MKSFQYQNLSRNFEEELCKLLGKITHHMHPNIVNLITEKNKLYKDQFISESNGKVDSSSFFYDKSDCVFPGFRRPINKEKTGNWKNKVSLNDGCVLNDNTFPRHIWAYMTRNRAYSGGNKGMWTTSGLGQFELAHVFSHKKGERTLEREAFKNFSDAIQPYGLFTSASNVVLIPKGFAKPTDHMRSVKLCFYQRHLNLYGNNVCGLGELIDDHLPRWFDEIEWLEPTLPEDWELKTNNLLKYRDQYIKNKYSKLEGTTI